MALRRWLLAGGRPERRSPLLSASRALAFEAARKLQHHLPAVPMPELPPLFLLGLWRSGTTLLHGLLGALPTFVTPRGWQCFRPATLRLTPPPRHGMSVPRPMDGGRIETMGPQEDEFALLLLGEQSLYRGFLDPRRLSELTPLLFGADDTSFGRPLSAFIAAVAAGAPARPLLKSPNHLFRAAALSTIFPGHLSIVTVRDPAETYWSTLRMWSTMTRYHGLWVAPEHEISRFVVRALSAGANHLVELCGTRPVAVIRFEALIRDPVTVVLRTLSLLGIAHGPDAAPRLRAAAARLRVVPRTEPRPVPPEAEAACAQLAEAQQVLLAGH